MLAASPTLSTCVGSVQITVGALGSIVIETVAAVQAPKLSQAWYWKLSEVASGFVFV
jgi:hypothetical protein